MEGTDKVAYLTLAESKRKQRKGKGWGKKKGQI
jgi:hypothetical protein